MREKCKINGQNEHGKTKKKYARRTHPDHTRGTQQLIHQLVINAPYTEYEASNGYVFISSNKRKFKQGGS